MLAALASFSGRLNRMFRAILRTRPYDAAQIEAFCGITPAAASRAGGLAGFLRDVDRHGQRLAQLNVPLTEAEELLREFAVLQQREAGDGFQPAREQLQLVTILTLRQAYYDMREAEAQAFFGMYRAEAEAESLDDLLRRMVRILARALRARAGRFIVGAGVGNAGIWRRCAASRSFRIAPLGMMQFGFAARGKWMPRQLALLESASQRIREAAERYRLSAAVRRLDAQARHAEEQERRRIGRELHDEAGQSLLVLRLQLELMERDAPAELRERLAEARENAARTVVELRRIVAALSPEVLERLGMERAMRQLGARFRKLHGAKLRMAIARCDGSISPQAREVIYRVAQEALWNAARHSHADKVNLCLRATDKTLRLSVSDDGAGFCAEEAACKPMSFGLAGMRERADLLGGSLQVKSAPGKGTAVILQLPRNCAQETPNGKDSHISD